MNKVGNNNVMPLLVMQPIKTLGYKFKTLRVLFHKPRRFDIAENWEFTLNNGSVISLPYRKADSDGASFPWWLSAIVPTLIFYFVDDKWVIAALLILFAALGKIVINAIGIAFIAGVFHDYLYKHHYIPLKDGTRYLDGCSRWKADRFFIDVHYQVNGIRWIAWLTGLILYTGSFISWFKYRKQVNHSEFPIYIRWLSYVF